MGTGIDSETKKARHIFVYGTLRSAYSRLPPSSRALRPPQVLQAPNRWVGVATISGYKMYDIGIYPGVVPCDDNTFKVIGDLYIVEDCELPLLDDYEGIFDHDDDPKQYERISVTATLEKNGEEEEILCWLYIYKWRLDSTRFIEHGDYVKYCVSRMIDNKS